MNIYKNNKGFTLIELLGVIIILGLITSISIYSAINIMDTIKSKSYKVTINNIENEANNYVMEETVSSKWVLNNVGNSEYQCVTVQNLIDTGYFKSDILESYVKEDRKVLETDNIYLLRDRTTKSVTKNVLLINDELMPLCKDYSTVRDNPEIAYEGSCNNLTYNGEKQTLISNGSGVTYKNNKGTNAGEYTVTIDANDNYIFSDGTTSKKIKCSISKANGFIELSSTSDELSYGTNNKLFEIISHHGGEISVITDNNNVSASVNNDVVTLSNLDKLDVGTKITVTVKISMTDNYTEASEKYTLAIIPSSSKPSLNISNPYSYTNWYNKQSKDNGELYIITLSAIDNSGLGIDYYAYKTNDSGGFVKYENCSGNTCDTTPWIKERFGESVTLKVCDKNGSCTEKTTNIYIDVTPPVVNCNPDEAYVTQTIKYISTEGNYVCGNTSLAISPKLPLKITENYDISLEVVTDNNDSCKVVYFKKNCRAESKTASCSIVFNVSDNHSIRKRQCDVVFASDFGDTTSEDRWRATSCNCIKGYCTSKMTYTIIDIAQNITTNVFMYYHKYDDWETYQYKDVCKNK